MLVDANTYEIARQNHPVWVKIPAVLDAMQSNPSADWIWWLDLDTLIMASNSDLYDYLLGPEAMTERLLKGKRVVPNDRIRIKGKPLPELETGEVVDLQESCIVDDRRLIPTKSMFSLHKIPTALTQAPFSSEIRLRCACS